MACQQSASVVVNEAPQERELATLIQNLDPDEVAELARECLGALLKPCNLGLNLRSQQRFHAATGKLGSSVRRLLQPEAEVAAALEINQPNCRRSL